MPCVLHHVHLSSLFSGVQMALALPCQARQLLNWGPQWAWQEGFYAAPAILRRALQGSCKAPSSSVYAWLACAALALFAAGFGCGLLVRRRPIIVPLNVAHENSVAVQVGGHPAWIGSSEELPRQLAAYLGSSTTAGALPKPLRTPVPALTGEDGDGAQPGSVRHPRLRRLQRGGGTKA